MTFGNIGEFAALGAVAGWTISALSFESAGKRIGSLPVNVIRLFMAACFLAIIGLIRGFTPWPTNIGLEDTLWLLASGFVGFFVGDLLLFRSFIIIGARMAMLIMSLSPLLSALLDFLVFGTPLALWDGAGMFLTMVGVTLAVAVKPRPSKTTEEKQPKVVQVHPVQRTSLVLQKGKHSRGVGILLAIGGAAGQSGGMILGKLGLAEHDALGASFIRSIGGLAGFIPLMLLIGFTGRILQGLRDKKAMMQLGIGSIAGPVVGVTAVLVAIRYSPISVVSSITALVPIVIILPAAVFLGDRAKPREIAGAVLAVTGVVVLFLT